MKIKNTFFIFLINTFTNPTWQPSRSIKRFMIARYACKKAKHIIIP